MGDFRNIWSDKKNTGYSQFIEIQTQSYEKFLQKGFAPAKRVILVCRVLLRVFSHF